MNETKKLIEDIKSLRGESSVSEQAIDEMAKIKVCNKRDNFGIVIEVREEDHAPPAHAHTFYASDDSPAGRFVIKTNPPSKEEDIEGVPPSNPSHGELTLDTKKKILRWAGKTTDGTNNWKLLRHVWNLTHENYKV